VTDDPYTDPSTGVLRNRLGISDDDELAAAEADLSDLRLHQLELSPVGGAYDLAHLQAIHRQIFGDVYPWAGEIRSVAISKEGSMFCLPQQIVPYAAGLFGGLAAEQHLVGLDREPFVDRLAFHYSELNALHPFREGNGRAQRAFLSQLAVRARYAVEWAQVDRMANIEASREALTSGHEPLRRLLEDIVHAVPMSAKPTGSESASARHRRRLAASDDDANRRRQVADEAARRRGPRQS